MNSQDVTRVHRAEGKIVRLSKAANKTATVASNAKTDNKKITSLVLLLRELSELEYEAKFVLGSLDPKQFPGFVVPPGLKK